MFSRLAALRRLAGLAGASTRGLRRPAPIHWGPPPVVRADLILGAEENGTFEGFDKPEGVKRRSHHAGLLRKVGLGKCSVLAHVSAISENKLVYFQLLALHSALSAIDAAVVAVQAVFRGSAAGSYLHGNSGFRVRSKLEETLGASGVPDDHGWFGTGSVGYSPSRSTDLFDIDAPCVAFVLKGLASVYDSKQALRVAVQQAVEQIRLAVRGNRFQASRNSSLFRGPMAGQIPGHIERFVATVHRHVLYSDESVSAEQLRDILHGSDVYLAPYSAEGFNLPVLEAVAVGTPVITTSGGPTDEFLPEGAARAAPSMLQRAYNDEFEMNVSVLQPSFPFIARHIVTSILSSPAMQSHTDRLLEGLGRACEASARAGTMIRSGSPSQQDQLECTQWLASHIERHPSYMGFAAPSYLAVAFDREQVGEGRAWLEKAGTLGPHSVAEKKLTWSEAAAKWVEIGRLIMRENGIPDPGTDPDPSSGPIDL